MNIFVLSDLWSFYLIATLSAFIFSSPLFLYFIKNSKKIDPFLLYIFGIINLLFGLFVYANLNYFWDIRKFDLIIFLLLFIFLESGLVLIRFKEWKRPVFQNWKSFVIIFIVSFGGFYVLNINYFDKNENLFFNPGYGINHDYIISIGLVKSFFSYNDNSGERMKNYYNYSKDSGYPIGGTYLNIYFVKLLRVDPYFIYQKVLTWIYLLNVFIIYYFGLIYFKNKNVFLRISLLVVSLMSVFNYLSLSIVNSSVLASTIAIPFTIFLMLWVLVNIKKVIIDTKVYLLVLFLGLTDLIFIYLYINAVFYLMLIFVLFIVYGIKMFKNSLAWKTVAVSCLCFLLPLNLILSKHFLGEQLGSGNREMNLFKGMMGNTIGFINPIIPFSIWSSSADYRFYPVDSYNLWLFFSVMSPLLLLLIIKENDSDEHKKFLITLVISFLFFVAFTFWITKSPYQNVKTLHVLSDAWPLLLLLLLSSNLLSKSITKRMVTTLFICSYAYFVFKSATFASSYIGVPIVKSNYELMKIESDVCNNDSKLLFLGRDEVSKYFLLSCKDVFLYYDRFDNNAAFWEVIALNKLVSLNQECENNSLNLTKIDYTGYQRILVDKCFKFDNKDFKLEKEYENYNLWKLKSL